MFSACRIYLTSASASASSSSKPVLPNLHTFIQSCRGVSDHLMKTQQEGFGFNLVKSMSFDPERDVDGFVLNQRNSITKNDVNSEIEHHSPHHHHHRFTSFAQPFGCFASTVAQEHSDATNHIHTGILATLADVQTSLHLWGLVGPKSLHVSVGIDLNFCAPQELEAPKPGERLVCLTRSPKVGKQLAFLEYSLYTISDATLMNAMKAMLEHSAKGEKSNCGVLMSNQFLLSRQQQRQEEGKSDVKHGTNEDCHLMQQHREISNVEELKNESLAFQSSLLYLYGKPFATGWHEKCFIQGKSK